MLGYYSAQTFAAAGADLALVDLPVCEERLKERAQELESEYGVKANYYCANLTDEEAVDKMFIQIDEEMDGIDIVHSNAGVGGARTPDYETPLADYIRVINGNLITMFLVDTAACRVMIKRGKGGSIVNTCSMGGGCVMQGPPFTTFDNSSYGTSKAGCLYFTKSLASQVIKFGIRVNSISPGHITPRGGGQLADNQEDKETFETFSISQPAKRTCEVEELMGGLLYLASDASSYCVGMDLLIDGGHRIW